MAKGRKNQAPPPVWATDLVLKLEGDTLTCTVSPNAQWAGIQKFVSQTSNDGAVAIFEAQRNYSTPPGDGATTSCKTQGAGYYRGWSSDFNYNIHVSNWVQVS